MRIDSITEAVQQEFPRVVEERRYLHRHPCVSFHEGATKSYLCSVLEQEGIPYRQCGLNGIVVRLKGEKTGPTIAFRADFDALPLQEESGVSFASEVAGVMHACGHDSHTAVLLGIVRILKQHPEWIAGEVVFLFQYAEELPPGGAIAMIEDGCLEGVDRIYGMHVSDELDTGTVGVCTGKYMAASDSFQITFSGNGGHGSRPYAASDTVSAAALAIININNIIGRFVSPLRSAVVSVCNIHGGHAYNIIPKDVSIEGTIRTYESETAELIREKIHEAAKNAAEYYNTALDFSFQYGYPAVVNSERETDVVRKTALLLKQKLEEIEPTPVGEDFSRYLQHVPGTFFRIGIRNEAIDAVFPLHDCRFRIDEDAMAVAMKMFLGIYFTETNQI